MPDARWRLFIHEVNGEVNFQGKSMVVVFAEDKVTPIDVVSDANFYTLERNDHLRTAVITSYAIDRRTQQPYLHLTNFMQDGNEHVLQAAQKWEATLRVGASTGEKEMLVMHRWLTRRILEAEYANPRLRELKNAIAAASEAMDQTKDDTARRELLKDMDKAVFALIREVEQTKMGV